MAIATYDSSTQTGSKGAFSAQTSTGAKVTKRADGRHTIDIRNVRAVGIRNVVDVETHEITTVANSRSHFVRFLGGGELRFAYSNTGQLLKFDWDNLNFVLTPDDELVFFRCADPDGDFRKNGGGAVRS